MRFVMPALLGTREENEALCRRLGLQDVEYEKDPAAPAIRPADSDEAREALMARALREHARVLLAAETVEELEALANWANHWLNRSASPDELWDLCDDEGRPTGRLHRRGDPLGEGEKHLCVHIWIRGDDGRYLITRRSPGKSMAGRWECTGGSVLAGEDSLAGALREVREETGLRLDPACGRRVLRFGGEHYICDAGGIPDLGVPGAAAEHLIARAGSKSRMYCSCRRGG